MKLGIKRYIYLLLMLGVFSLSVLSGCSGAADTAAMEDTVTETASAVAVSVKTATNGALSKIVRFSGKTAPNDESAVSSKLGGKVVSVNFDVGDRVSKGDLLFTLDDTDILAAVSAAQAQYDLAAVNLSRATGGAVELQLETLRQQVEQAARAVETAETNLGRQKELFDAGAVSRVEFEAAENALKSAKEHYTMAKTNYDLSSTKIQAENNATAEAQLAQARIALDTAKTQLINTAVYAQISGIISSRSISPGAIVSPGMPVFTIVDDNPIYIEFGVTDDTVSKIAPGKPVIIDVPAASIESISGKIFSISPAANPQTQLYTVKTTVSNADGKLKLGMFASVSIPTETISNAITVPVGAVRTDGERSYVFIVQNGFAKQVFVETGISNDTEIIITQGINENDMVITKGQDFVSDGTPVSVV